MDYTLSTRKSKVTAKDFISLSRRCGWGKSKRYVLDDVTKALKQSSYIVSIWDGNLLIGCGRALSDDYFFTTIPDLFVDPKYQRKGLGKQIMNTIIERYSHSPIFFGSQPGNESFFEKLGFEKGIQSYQMARKKRRKK